MRSASLCPRSPLTPLAHRFRLWAEMVRRQRHATECFTGATLVAGDSRAGNPTLASGSKPKREGGLGLLKGLYRSTPISPDFADPGEPSRREQRDHARPSQQPWRHGYGIDAFNERDPLAWPGFATLDDVRGFPSTVINVIECDPLRDEGSTSIVYCSGPRPCPVSADDGHGDGTDVLTRLPRISRDTARDIAVFAPNSRRERRAGKEPEGNDLAG